THGDDISYPLIPRRRTAAACHGIHQREARATDTRGHRPLSQPDRAQATRRQRRRPVADRSARPLDYRPRQLAEYARSPPRLVTPLQAERKRKEKDEGTSYPGH